MDETFRDDFQREGTFLTRWGRARERGENPCKKKLCFTSTRVAPMAQLLYELSLRDDCWAVKLDAAVGRHGMVRGRCFLLDEEEVAKVWKQYKVTDQILCTIQDDDFTAEYRDQDS